MIIIELCMIKWLNAPSYKWTIAMLVLSVIVCEIFTVDTCMILTLTYREFVPYLSPFYETNAYAHKHAHAYTYTLITRTHTRTHTNA